MLKLVFTFLLEFIVISAVQSEKYLECTFDQGDLPCKLHPVGTALALQTMSSVIIDDLSMDPIMPLSDVTSITVPTIGNNFTCQLPYKLDGSFTDLYFCSRLRSSMESASCFTEDTTKHECMLGQYVLVQMAPRENLTYFIEVLGTSGLSCLSFYYYITRPNAGQIKVRFADIAGGGTEQLGTAFDVPYNGWHRTDFNFQPNVSNYQIQFELQRSEVSDKLVFIALDEIKVTDGRCELDIVETTNKVDQTTQTSTQEAVTTATTQIAVTFTAEEIAMSSTQPLITSTEPPTTSTKPLTASTESSSALITSVATTVPWTSQTSFDSTISSTPVPVTTVSATTTSIASTGGPFRPLFRCDFTTSCFGRNDLRITNGTEFNPTHLSLNSESPRAPTSDAASVTTPTNNNQICSLPYRPKLDDSIATTPWDMWFCYNNKCPVPNGQTATCASGSYGLVSLKSSESMKTIVDALTPNVGPRDASGDQCLRFYYYFTVYHGIDWGQQIQLWIRPNNQSSNRRAIGVLTVNEMRQNRWHSHEITFPRGSSADTLQMDFVVSRQNGTEDTITNGTVHFALDDIELYDYNCSYVQGQLPQTTTVRPLPITTTEPEATHPPAAKKKPQWELILGLSLGIGIPVILLAAGGALFYVRKRNRGPKLEFIEMDRSLYDQSNVGDSFSSSHPF